MSSLSSLTNSPRRRVYFVSLAIVIFFSALFTLGHGIFPQVSSTVPRPTVPDEILQSTEQEAPYRANATFVMLCKNSELDGVVSSIRRMEDRFNKDYGYPWVLLNDQPFEEEFKERVAVLTRANVTFGYISPEIWNQPDFIDEKRASAARAELAAQGIIYADSVPFNSGFFYHHELLNPYRYYWRVEPSVDYFCNVNYDPFEYMEKNNKTYGFTISLLEWHQTIPTLWKTVREFTKQNPQYLHPDNAMNFVSNDKGANYNNCHFWSNFEIADMDFWRGEAYSKFFEFLESTGGFYYERWGDAPVHSIAVSLFAPKDSIHYFYDIGYRHDSFQHCPSGDVWQQGRCSCDPKHTFSEFILHP
ncbi:alpha-1,2-mannosyltransferase [Coprinopsis marcescibilis]|uniref:Alpha-1,2-mannosyltransferase n=1 Tax=Coprinopsis marcescibilis TaxID=230819 RepID=A0A5C3LAT5_COPMA|nr:alpha-1,2-mannosyltransferase [Coprinopsis marcescibilis]